MTAKPNAYGIHLRASPAGLAASALLLIACQTTKEAKPMEATTMHTPQHLSSPGGSEGSGGSGAGTSFATQPWDASGALVSTAYTLQRVTFQSQGIELVGNLFTPPQAGKRPAIVILGPVAFVKEQAPMQYASRLAKAGYVTLVFDPRYHGESGGEPRRFEHGAAKIEDLRAALDYLATVDSVDPNALFMIGICQGVNWVIGEVATDPRVKAVALVAGHYLTPETAALYLGGEENAAARIARAKLAEDAFRQTGEVRYIPIVSQTDPNALLTAKPIYEFYSRWGDRGPFWSFHGLWENRITAMSEAGIWGHRVDEAILGLKTPTLMIHADRAASGPNIPKQLFEKIPAQPKKLVWLGGQGQMQFYEDPVTIDLVVPHIDTFLGQLAR